jgi:sporulation protein YlmC with PRC-barrel domain
MEREHRSDRFTAIEEQYAGYEVYDRNGEKIGKVDDLFVDESDRPEYIGVKRGFLGLEGTSLIGSRSTLIPMEVVRDDEGHKRIEVSVIYSTAASTVSGRAFAK